MRPIIIILTLFICANISFGQENKKWKEGDGFKSVYQDFESGKFKGTVSGILIVQKKDGQQIILDFQGSEAILNILRDEDEVYDVSTKSYTGKTTSGRTEIKYETYAWANGIGINLNGQWFELSAIDGACDMVINGIEYSYHSEKDAEYLVIRINKELDLSNWQYLIRTEHTMEPNNIDDLKVKKKVIKILPNSTLTFAMKRE
jgi:hypothetical protein